jgi:hypothetical protein
MNYLNKVNVSVSHVVLVYPTRGERLNAYDLTVLALEGNILRSEVKDGYWLDSNHISFFTVSMMVAETELEFVTKFVQKRGGKLYS